MGEPIEIDIVLPPGVEGLLQIALEEELRTPGTILELIPPRTITVSSLLEKDLPALLSSSVANFPSTKTCTTHCAPRWTTEELFKALIPPRTWLSDLEIIVKKEWLTCPGVTSVHHPTIPGLYLPLWAGHF